jgi:hypothetical protein
MTTTLNGHDVSAATAHVADLLKIDLLSETQDYDNEQQLKQISRSFICECLSHMIPGLLKSHFTVADTITGMCGAGDVVAIAHGLQLLRRRCIHMPQRRPWVTMFTMSPRPRLSRRTWRRSPGRRQLCSSHPAPCPTRSLYAPTLHSHHTLCYWITVHTFTSWGTTFDLGKRVLTSKLFRYEAAGTAFHSGAGVLTVTPTNGMAYSRCTTCIVLHSTDRSPPHPGGC